MTKVETTRNIGKIKYFLGSDPKMRAQLKVKNRPTEFGDKLWASSVVLINYLEENPMDLKALRVLEIGCGWGLVGIYLAKAYSCEVTCSDFDERVLPIVKLQAELNGVSVSTKKASFSDLSESFLKEFDLIVGVEVCYSEEVGKEIRSLVKRSFKGRVKQVLIVDPGRPDFQDLYDSCVKTNIAKVIDLPGSVNGKTTQLLSISKK